MKIEAKKNYFRIVIAALALALAFPTFHAASRAFAANAPLTSALCQIVYPLDQFPSAKTYHYTFYGNAFFINEDGYLITAAHVLSVFRQGGQPHIIAGLPDEPRQLLKASLVAADWDHDVAILRATPNPFPKDRKLSYLSLSVETPAKGKSVLAASLMATDVENSSNLDAPEQDLDQGQVLDYQFHQEETGTANSELILVSQDIAPGQSGSPLVLSDSQGVVGIIVGRWMNPVVAPASVHTRRLFLSPGAALRTHYAISLLQRNHIAWHAAVEASSPKDPSAQETGYFPPAPVSVVGTSYPPQALFGGDVLLDALIDASGKPTEVRVVSGDGPFVEPALNAVRTWTFTPARLNGQAVEAHVGIVFQFPQSFLPHSVSKVRKHEEVSAGTEDRGALPVLTVEPDYPPNTNVQGSVGLYNVVDSDGHIRSTSTLMDVEPLTTPSAAAMQRWQFAPARHAGSATDSVVIVVETFRRPTL